MKKLMIILLTLIMMPVIVFAGGGDDDVNKPKVVACSYNVNTTDGTHKIIMYYYNYEGSTEWEIYYKEANGREKTKGPDNFSDIFSTTGTPNVYMPDDVLDDLSNYDDQTKVFACPKNGYLDTAFWNEFCFDNDGQWCFLKYDTDGSTNFGTDDYTYISNEKTDDMAEDYGEDISENAANDVTGEDIVNGTVDERVQENIDEVTEENFNTDEGGVVPDGVTNYVNENQETITEQPREEIKEIKEEFSEKITEMYNNGEIDEATYNSTMDIINSYDEDEMFTAIWANNFTFVPVIIDVDSCDSLLGDPDTEGTPAFYLVIAFTVIKYVAIIILIILTTMDFVSAAASQDNDILKKTIRKAVIRAILCVVIFVLPTLIEFIMKYASDTADALCGIK